MTQRPRCKNSRARCVGPGLDVDSIDRSFPLRATLLSKCCTVFVALGTHLRCVLITLAVHARLCPNAAARAPALVGRSDRGPVRKDQETRRRTQNRAQVHQTHAVPERRTRWDHGHDGLPVRRRVTRLLTEKKRGPGSSCRRFDGNGPNAFFDRCKVI